MPFHLEWAQSYDDLTEQDRNLRRLVRNTIPWRRVWWRSDSLPLRQRDAMGPEPENVSDMPTGPPARRRSIVQPDEPVAFLTACALRIRQDIIS